MDPQRDLAAGFTQTVEGRQRHREVVPHAIHVNDDAIGLLLENSSVQMSDHDRAGRYWRQLAALVRPAVIAAAPRPGAIEWT